MFDFAKKKKMPILADLTRRFHMLTTDAKPDPPRDGSPGYTNNLTPPPGYSRRKSSPTPPEPHETEEIPENLDREQTKDRDEEDVENSNSGNESPPAGERKTSKETKYPRVKTKIPYRSAQTANVINYNIINSNGVKIGATKTYVCNVNQCAKNVKECDGNSRATKTRSMSKDIEILSACEREITLDDMFVIKIHIGHGWRDVVRRLGYSEGQLDQFEENHRLKGIDEVIYQVLLDWKQANTKDAQLGKLVNVLWSCREYDCAERLAAAQQVPS